MTLTKSGGSILWPWTGTAMESGLCQVRGAYLYKHYFHEHDLNAHDFHKNCRKKHCFHKQDFSKEKQADGPDLEQK